jgi:hypothetical protein
VFGQSVSVSGGPAFVGNTGPGGTSAAYVFEFCAGQSDGTP